jgi:toxin-antitoxin system PIN domain toxin
VTYTLDANILLYASDESSPVHRHAREIVGRLAAGPEIAYLFWPSLMAYLRIATHPAVFAHPLPLPDAIDNIAQLVNRPHVRTAGEGEGFWRAFREVAGDARPSGNLVPDAHLVTLMRENDVRTILTRDRGFRRYPGIEVRDPFAAADRRARGVGPPSARAR